MLSTDSFQCMHILQSTSTPQSVVFFLTHVQHRDAISKKHVIIIKYNYTWTEIFVFYSCYSRCGTLKNPHCSMAMSAQHMSKFAVLHRQW